MALLDEVAAKLNAEGVASSSGGTWLLVKGLLPDSSVLQDRIVAVLETGGRPARPRLGIDEPTFQVLVRGAAMNQSSTAYPEARAKIEAAKVALSGMDSTTLDGWYWGGCWAEQEPFFVGDDADYRPLFSCNFRAMRSRTS